MSTNTIEKIKKHPVFLSLAAAASIAGVVWYVSEQIRVAPLKERIEMMEFSCSNSKLDLTAHEIIAIPRNEAKQSIVQRPLQIIKKIAGMTASQSSTYLKNTYKDKWMRIRGPIMDYEGDLEGGVLWFSIDGIKVRVVVSGFEATEAGKLDREDVITIDGKFENVIDSTLTLSDGDILIEG